MTKPAPIAVEMLASLIPVGPEKALRKARILNAAMEAIPEYCRDGLSRFACLAEGSAESDGYAAFDALIADLEAEMRRRAQ